MAPKHYQVILQSQHVEEEDVWILMVFFFVLVEDGCWTRPLMEMTTMLFLLIPVVISGPGDGSWRRLQLTDQLHHADPHSELASMGLVPTP